MLKYFFFFYQACNKYNGYSDFVQYFSEYVVHLQMAFWPSLLIFSCSKFSSWMKQEEGGEAQAQVCMNWMLLCCWPWIMMSKVHCKNVSHEIYPPLQKMLFLSTPNNHREIINQFFDPGSDLEVGGTARCGVMIYVWWSQYLCFKLQ